MWREFTVTPVSQNTYKEVSNGFGGRVLPKDMSLFGTFSDVVNVTLEDLFD